MRPRCIFMWNGVQWWSGPQRVSTRAPNGWLDHEITRMIQRELTHSRIMDPEDIEVSVQNGVVTLKGAVPSSTVKRAAAQVARQFAGEGNVRIS